MHVKAFWVEDKKFVNIYILKTFHSLFSDLWTGWSRLSNYLTLYNGKKKMQFAQKYLETRGVYLPLWKSKKVKLASFN